MQVKQHNKVLYHIQNMNICSDETPYDVFVFADHFPTIKDLKKIFKNEFKGCNYDNKETLEEWLTSSEIFEVYANEI